MLGFLVKLMVFLFIKLPLMLLAGVLKLLVLPIQLLALLVKGVGMLKYVVIAAVLVVIAKSVLAALETRGARATA